MNVQTKARLCGIVPAFFLLSCSTPDKWVRPGTTEMQFKQDGYQCKREAQFMALQRQGPPPPSRYGQTLSESAGQGLGYGFTQGMLERQYLDECMEGRGYTRSR